ncbi:MAG: hypothetical protein ACLU38_01235 [Dysosmobacter sp.]
MLDVMKDKTRRRALCVLGRDGGAVRHRRAGNAGGVVYPHAAARQRHRHRQEQSAGAVGRGRGRVGYLAAAAQVRQTGAVEGRYLRSAEAHEPAV